jgi:hypothetical protein
MSEPCPKCRGRLVEVAASVRAPAHDSCRQCGYYWEHPCVVVKPGIPTVVLGVNGRGLSAEQLEKERLWKRRSRQAAAARLREARGLA